jgi:hypothetical protein
MMKFSAVVKAIAIVSLGWTLYAEAAGNNRPLTLENRYVAVEIDRQNGAVKSIRDKAADGKPYFLKSFMLEATKTTAFSRAIWQPLYRSFG